MTTPNSDVLYAMSYVDLGKDGPLVMEAPPELQGILLDYWQRPIPVDGGKFFGDVGLAGPDGGKGGKFLLLPPGYKGAVPKGYYVYRSGTNNVFIFLRGFYEDPKNLTPAVAHLERTKIYPLNGEASAKPMKFPDASGVPVNMLPISDGSVFEQLKRLVDREGDNLAGPDWLGMLAAIGIVKDQPFTPMRTRARFSIGPRRPRYKTSRVIGFEEVVGGISYRSIRTATGSIPWPRDAGEARRRFEFIVDEHRWRVSARSTPGSTFSPTTIRSAPAWSRTRRARAPIT